MGAVVGSKGPAPGELSAERADGQVIGLASDLQHEAIGKVEARPTSIVRERSGDDVGVLDRRMRMVEGSDTPPASQDQEPCADTVYVAREHIGQSRTSARGEDHDER